MSGRELLNSREVVRGRPDDAHGRLGYAEGNGDTRTLDRFSAVLDPT